MISVVVVMGRTGWEMTVSSEGMKNSNVEPHWLLDECVLRRKEGSFLSVTPWSHIRGVDTSHKTL